MLPNSSSYQWSLRSLPFFFVKGPAADATDTPQPWGLLCNPVVKMIIFLIFPCNGAPVEWNWQGKPEVLGEKPVPVPLCSPQTPHAFNRDRTRASAVRGRRLTAWAMARPVVCLTDCGTKQTMKHVTTRLLSPVIGSFTSHMSLFFRFCWCGQVASTVNYCTRR
jgi:hypothetical protein